MNRTVRSGLLSLACPLLTLLSACGGGDPAPMAAAPRVTLAAPSPSRLPSQGAARQAGDYNDVMQQVYVAYFGRPADPAGLLFFEQQLLNAGAPSDLASLALAYGGNDGVRAVVDSFGNSAESAALYPGDNDSFILAVYRNVLNRVADDAGKAYWANLINSGAITRGNAAISIMSGAQGSDLAIVNNKTRVAANFTAAIVTPLQAKGYDGLAANVVVRNMLGTVSFDTDVATFQSSVNATLAGLASSAGAAVYAQVAAIVQSRCVSCHSARFASGGYAFDTAASIHANASPMGGAVASGFMPLGNATNMTDAERATFASWIALGAP